MLLNTSRGHQLLLTFQNPSPPMVLIRLYQVRTKIIVAVADNGHFGLIRDKTVVVCFLLYSSVAILFVNGCSWVLFRRVSRLVPAPLTYVANRCHQLKGSRSPEIRRGMTRDVQTACIRFI